jgi:hypothetical protein
MAKITRAELIAQATGQNPAQVVELLAPLATGLNRDGTTFTLDTNAASAADSVVTGTLAALNDTVVVVLPQGTRNISILTTGTWLATTLFEISLDGGATWQPILVSKQDAAITGTAFGFNGLFTTSVPPGTTHFRVRASTYTSGTVAVTIGVSPSDNTGVAQLITRLPALTSGRMPVESLDPADIKASGTLTALNGTVTLALSPGQHSCSFAVGGTWVGTITFQVSLDNGTSYYSIQCKAAQSTYSTTTTPGNMLGTGAIPPGATHLRTIMSAYTSGTAAITIATSSGEFDPSPNINAALSASTSKIGAVGSAVMWFDDTIVPLAAGATYSGVARDILSGSASALIVASATYAGSFRAWAETDVAGAVLKHQVSRDSSATWRTIETQALTATPDGYACYSEMPVLARHHRIVIVNGPTAMGRLTAGTVQVAV